MKRATFYQCPICGNIVIKVVDGGGTVSCCGQPMQVIEPNTTDAAQEKHVPAIAIEGDVLTAQVGSVEHPMAEDHYIQWIYLVTEEGVLARCLNPGEAPKAAFNIAGQKPLAVFEYCNKHGLWMAEV